MIGIDESALTRPARARIARILYAREAGALGAGETGALRAGGMDALRAGGMDALRAGEAGALCAGETGALRAGGMDALRAGEAGALCAGEAGALRAGEAGALGAGEAGALGGGETGALRGGETGALRAGETGALRAGEACVSRAAAMKTRGVDAAKRFSSRQQQARERLDHLIRFYGSHGCRMSRVHLLTASAVTLGRFCGLSESFDRIGEALMPVARSGRPRTRAWRAYARACERGLPVEIRDEAWISAHLLDMERVRSGGLMSAFERELRDHEGDPLWRLLHQHMELTLDARLIDGPALAGAVAGETAVAQGFSLGLRRLFRAGWALIACYALETLRALVLPRHPTDRRAALQLLRALLTAWTAARVYRRGVRALHRGRDARPEEAWPLLAQVLGPDVGRVHPMIVAFYSNPARFPVRAWLTLNTVGSRVVSWLATRCLGQGLYETDRGPLPARFRVYRRDDGSMHFVRELYCGGALRVFDSDFVVRDGALHEVFPDCGIDVEMEVRVLPGGGLSIRGRAVRVHGLRVPWMPLDVEFVSQVDGGHLQIDGHLRRASGDRAELGCIHYRVARGRPQSGRADALDPAGAPPPRRVPGRRAARLQRPARRDLVRLANADR